MNGSATARISIAVATRVDDVDVLERVLQRQGVDDRGEHAHVVGGRAVHALGARRQAAEQVAAADDDGDLDAELLDLADLLGDLRGDRRVDPERLLAHEGFAGEFEEDAAIDGRRHRGDYIGFSQVAGRPGAWRIQAPGKPARTRSRSYAASPTLKRTNRGDGDVLAELGDGGLTIWPIVTFGSRIDGWSSRQTCS